jgi:hypothetical protein
MPLETAFAPVAVYNAPGDGFSHIEFKITKSPESPATYQLERAAILPSDVRIEAVLYAQNNSFFVIPGPWFNDDAGDTMDHYITGVNGVQYLRPHPDQNAAPPIPGFTDERFPFFGQPIDMRITIDGSVVENMPADTSDQTAWMLKWGWIPKIQGSPMPAPGQATAHESLFSLLGGTAAPLANLPGLPLSVQSTLPGIGLNIAYDNAAGTAAAAGTASGNTAYVRLDQYGRPLPYAPALPVSPDLLYSGATPGNSLVQ